MKVQEVKIDVIKVEDRARQDLGDIEELAADIDRVGLIHPITIDQENRLISGERRLEAFRHLGRETIPAISRSISGPVDYKEIELIENIGRLDFKWQEVCVSIRDLYYEKDSEKKKNTGEGLTQGELGRYLGRSQQFINKMIEMAELLDVDPEYAKHKTMEDARKESLKLEEEATITELKKRHQEKRLVLPPYTEGYLIGDALEEIKRLESDRYHLADVDPPYAVELDDLKREGDMDEYNEWTLEFYEEQFLVLMREVYRVLAPGSHAIVWYGMSNHCVTHEIVRKAGFHTPEFPGLWYKGATGQTNWPDRTLASSYEPFIYAKKDTALIAYGKEGRSNVFHFNPVPPRKKWHPTQKPIGLMEEVLRTFALPGSDVLVPFLGSGVTLMAADRCDMTAFGWDLSETYKYKFLDNVNKIEVVSGEELSS